MVCTERRSILLSKALNKRPVDLDIQLVSNSDEVCSLWSWFEIRRWFERYTPNKAHWHMQDQRGFYTSLFECFTLRAVGSEGQILIVKPYMKYSAIDWDVPKVKTNHTDTVWGPTFWENDFNKYWPILISCGLNLSLKVTQGQTCWLGWGGLHTDIYIQWNLPLRPLEKYGQPGNSYFSP